MNEATKHRGPDGVGIFRDDHVTFGQNLLAIMETPIRGHQPFVSPDENHVLIFNGEIYNYQALRKELEGEGVHFDTHGDTEVVFRGLMRHGATFFARLDGMFAIAFYDKQKQKVYLARDRAGMKPLYIAHYEGALIFSSEIRGLLAYGVRPVLDMEATKLFFLFGYPPTAKTMFEGIKKLPAGAYREINLTTNEEHDEWFGWSDRTLPNATFTPISMRQQFGSTVHAHTMGLRPFGIFLSGGLDSTIVLHELAQREKNLVKTYTTRFETKDARYNEDADLASRLTGDYHIDHHELLVTERDFIDAYESAIVAMEEPRYNHSVPAYWLLAQMASSDITVVLDGSGGDELFLGYPRYFNAVNIEAKYATYPKQLLNLYYTLRGASEGLVHLPHTLDLSKLSDEWCYVNKITPPSRNPAFKFMGDFDITKAGAMLREGSAPPLTSPLSDRTNAIAELDRWFWLANEDFMRTDKINMHFGMEGRFPFLANDVVRYANSISSKEKLAQGTKGLMREAYRGLLPDYIINKKKTGWSAPVGEWMSHDFGRMVGEILSKEYYPPTNALFDFDALKRRELDGKTAFTLHDLKQFLPIVQFQVWAKAFKIELP